MNEHNDLNSSHTSLEEKLHETSEQNANLKKYVQEINDECLELHANMFEEANRQVTQVLAAKLQLQRRCDELSAQNDILKKEVLGLKRIINQTSNSSQYFYTGWLDNKKIPSFTANDRGLRGSGCGGNRYVDDDNLAYIDDISFKIFEEWFNYPNKVLLPPCQYSTATLRELTYLRDVSTHVVIPCLSFHDQEISQLLQSILPHEQIYIDPLAISSQSGMRQQCRLTLMNSPCSYQLHIAPQHSNDITSNQMMPLSTYARNRLVSICDFYRYLSLIHRGLILSVSPVEVYKKLQYHCKLMCITRLGFELPPCLASHS